MPPSRSGSGPGPSNLPPLSGLAGDDDEEDRPRLLRSGPNPAPPAPGSRPPPLPPSLRRDPPADDGATIVAASPFFPATATGDVELTAPMEKLTQPEPRVSVDSTLLGVPLPALHAGDGAEATRFLSLPQAQVEQVQSGRVAPVQRQRPSGPNAPLPALGGDGQEQTRIVSSLNLVERSEPRSRRTRALPEPDRPGQPAAPAAAEGRVSGPRDSGSNNKGKKNPVQQIKDRTRAKAAPLDPQRLFVQQEVEQRKARETGMFQVGPGGPAAGLPSSLASSLGDEIPQESTIIGRFLGLFSPAAGAAAGPAAAAAPPAAPGGEPRARTLAAVEEAPFLEGLNPQYLRDAVDSGDLVLVSLGRDTLVDTAGQALLVLEGQLALGRFDRAVLEREQRAQRQHRPGDPKADKREHQRRLEVGPLIRLAAANLAVFQEGDVVGPDLRIPGTEAVALYSATPVRLLAIKSARLEGWRRTYQFFADRSRHAAAAAAARIGVTAGAQGLIADFYLRHGMSIAMTLRVREVDKCIECYECEKACETRYGVKRLSLKGKILGGLDFVDCCRTCMDQRCIDPCAYDAIKFDVEKKEVLIVEEACTGCSMCALACPYDAIEMHELEERPLLKLRLEKQDKLAHGEQRPRKAVLRRIASKCDHCVTYADQACITACPTNALLEVQPENIFRDRPERLVEAALGGFNEEVPVRPADLFPAEHFFRGLRQGEDRRQVSEGYRRRGIGFLWALGIVAFAACFVEVLLRRLWPELSLQFYYQTHHGGLDPDMALENVDFRAGCDFAVWLGWVGSGILFSSIFYSAHKWIPGLKKLASQQILFDYHIFAGTVGALFVLLHSAARLDNWVSLAVWSMVATVLSGLVGRYLSTELPDLAAQAALVVLDLERQLADLRNRHAGVMTADHYLDGLRQRYLRGAEPGPSGAVTALRALLTLFRDELTRPLRATLLRRRLVGIKEKRARRRVARLTARLALHERRRILLPRIEPMFKEWKTIHVPFAVLLSILAGIHIVQQLAH